MESPRFENQSDAEDYIRELEKGNRQITPEELANCIEETLVMSRLQIDEPALTYPERIEFRRIGSWRNGVLLCAKIILLKYKVMKK
jgi:hypothetical protein